ncbi:MAG: methionine--tRNA ligase [Planctomycetota bacterium]
MKRFFITTPIYYVNSRPHLGHAYTSIVGDIFCRFHRLFGEETFFLTGTDEHGQKVASKAREEGKTPQAFADEVSALFKALLPKIHVEAQRFIRTTDAEHKRVVQAALVEIHAKGLVYSDDYEGDYCVGCERYLDADDLTADGLCKDHQKPPQKMKEKNYFFKMSAFQQRLVDHIKKDPSWIHPEQYRKEIESFLKAPLHDLCISRPKSRLDWGIEIPFDRDYVTYVWFDALLNYVSALGGKGAPDYQRLWPVVHHLMAKDIIKTHCVYWPCMLMALDIPLPSQFVVHGYWVVGQSKMSKSLGNVVDPLAMGERCGFDPLRYVLASAMTFGSDADFTEEMFAERYNADLANNLGNLVSRTLTLVHKNRGGVAPSATSGPAEAALEKDLVNLLDMQWEAVRRFELHKAAGALKQMGDAVNKYVDTHEPWKLAKDPVRSDDLDRALLTMCRSLRFLAGAMHPVMPEISAKILGALGEREAPRSREFFNFGALEPGRTLGTLGPLFPRLEKATQKS